MITQAIYLISFFITVGLITGALTLLSAAMTLVVSCVPLIIKWQEIIKRPLRKRIRNY